MSNGGNGISGDSNTLVLTIAAGTGWLALRSLANGATHWPWGVRRSRV